MRYTTWRGFIAGRTTDELRLLTKSSETGLHESNNLTALQGGIRQVSKQCANIGPTPEGYFKI